MQFVDKNPLHSPRQVNHIEYRVFYWLEDGSFRYHALDGVFKRLPSKGDGAIHQEQGR